MILTTHLLTGAALGANIHNPIAVAGLSVALHFLLDTLPHGDYLNKKSRPWEFWKVLVDLTIGISLATGIIFLKKPLDPQIIRNIAIGIFFSLLPDGLTFCYWRLKMDFLKPVYEFHQNLHRFKNGSQKREFRLKNNYWDLTLSFCSLAVLMFFL